MSDNPVTDNACVNLTTISNCYIIIEFFTKEMFKTIRFLNARIVLPESAPTLVFFMQL